MENSAFKYVPELDGIRGIAIIVVLIHHQLTPFSVSGGFLGVDLFFVLSGFLITSLLLGEFETTGAISIRNFYMRRILRLGPALVLYLAGTILVGYYLGSIDLTRQLKLVAMAVGYLTNWRMALGWDSSLDPTAIIWSLSIEEQFYVVWPLLLYVCLKLGFKKRHIAIGLGFVIVAITLHRLNLLNSGAELSRLYYGTDTRADALLVGCLTAFVPRQIVTSRLKRWLNVVSFVAAVSIAVLIVSVHFTDRVLYAGGFTLVAVLAAIVILATASTKPWLLSHILRLSPLRWFGRISYGLYLWHWLVVRTTSFYFLGYWEPWARLALAVAIAAASFYLIEVRFNNLKRRYATRRLTSETKEKSSDVSPFAVPMVESKTS